MMFQDRVTVSQGFSEYLGSLFNDGCERRDMNDTPQIMSQGVIKGKVE